ncbi:MAG: hypothetical protein ACO34E_06785 [Limisphaerales bacterium]|jgi:hypothetical protein
METIIELLEKYGISASWQEPGYTDVPLPGGFFAFGTLNSGIWSWDRTMTGKIVASGSSDFHIDTPPEQVAAWIRQVLTEAGVVRGA